MKDEPELSPELLAHRGSWRQAGLAAPWWHLAEALLWIAHRDPEIMAEMLATEDAAEETLGFLPTTAAEVLSFVMTSISPNYPLVSYPPRDSVKLEFFPDVVITNPLKSLLDALRSGTIVSSGHLDREPTRTLIDQLQ